jgi:cytochrome c-type biogenesis protein CcmE
MQNATLAKIALTAAVVVGGGGFLVYSSVGHAQHYEMVDKLLAGGLDHWTGKELKVHGFVEGGSIVETVVDQEMQRSFVLQKDGKKIRVFSRGPKPDTFKDQAEVVATGRLVPAKSEQKLADALCKTASTPGCPIHADAEQAYVLESTELMAKCPSKYGDAPKLDTQFK